MLKTPNLPILLHNPNDLIFFAFHMSATGGINTSESQYSKVLGVSLNLIFKGEKQVTISLFQINSGLEERLRSHLSTELLTIVYYVHFVSVH